MGKFKFFSAFLAAMMLTVGSMSVTASAEEAQAEITSEEAITESVSDADTETEEITETEDSSETAEETDSTESTEDSSISEDTTEISSDTVLSDREYELIRELADGLVKEDEKIDYYGDDYYDTSGNASLIKSERIIYDTEEMQFIAVTTKDGAVFYILINYSAGDEEETVYFLNKVDTFDLYSLLYMTDDEEENGIDIERARQVEEAVLNLENPDTQSVTEDTDIEAETEETPVQESQSGSSNMMLYLLLGAIVLVGGGFAAFKFLKKPKSKSTVEGISEPEEEEDFDFYDSEEEVNEDNE